MGEKEKPVCYEKPSRSAAQKLLSRATTGFVEVSANKPENIVAWARALTVLRIRLDFISHGYGESLYCLIDGGKEALGQLLTFLGATKRPGPDVYAYILDDWSVHAITMEDDVSFFNIMCRLTDDTVAKVSAIDQRLKNSDFAFVESDDGRDVTPLTNPAIWEESGLL